MNGNWIREARQAEEGMVVYGTSDHFLNFGEALLTHWAAEILGARPVFFNYPKGSAWRKAELAMFEPYENQLSIFDSWALNAAGLPPMRILSLQGMISEKNSLAKWPLGRLIDFIRQRREIQSFRIASFPDQKPVYCSQKNDNWMRDFRYRTLGDLLWDPKAKLGGTLIYALYGYYLGRRPEVIGLLPAKRRPDVFGAFQAGAEIAGFSAKVFTTGEIDFMTKSQWQRWRQDKRWRKAPPWAVKALVQSDLSDRVCQALVVEKGYCALSFDEESGEISFVEGQAKA